jgi:transposase
MQKPKPAPVSVGIDVSKDALVGVIRFPAEEQQFTVPNSKNGITALHRKLRGCRCPIILESTGRYHILSAFLLSERGYDVRVVNPLIAKRYIAASVRKRKTDKSDASALAQMGVTEQRLPSRFVLSSGDIILRQKIGLLSSLEHKLQSLRHTMQTYRDFQGSMGVAASAAEEGLVAVIKSLERQKVALEREIEAGVTQDATKRKAVELAVSIPGISSLTASILCQLLNPACVSPKQWVAFVGYDVSERQSGTWQGKGRISKRGNPYLRKRLYMAAWGAVHNHQPFHAYYEQLRAAGRSYREALVIIARKLLRIVFAVLRNEKPFAWECCMLAA